ncbi:MAG: molybdenum cofactor guanylyltransferase [Deltaproteobacteria bacterium]|nr:molybdenum cofactor guanylyltransferase [Deltaproteobacteria bacterium]
MPSGRRGVAGPSYLSEEVGAIILAGGKNSRMGGEDKAFLTVDGQFVFERTLGLLQRCFPQVVVVSNHPERYREFAVEVTSDELPGLGPLGGLHAGLGRIRYPYAFVVACDMPFLRVEPMVYLVSRLHGQDAVIPEWEGDIEPLHALYATRLRAAIARAIERGARAIREFLPQLRVEFIAEAEMRAVAGAAESFRNVNTPEEAARFAVRRRADGARA